MKGIEIYLADQDYNGAMMLNCSASNCLALRVNKKDVSRYTELNAPGIYFLLVDSDSVYVGQSGLETVAKRVMNSHSGNIDASWHTVVGFVDKSNTLQGNELLYIENAMCEYAHKNFSKCLTSSPAKANCNSAYRISHYKLRTIQLKTCDQYIEDIIQYITLFPNTIFPQNIIPSDIIVTPVSNDTPASNSTSQSQNAPVSNNVETFFYASPKRDSEGKAEIPIHLGHTRARQTVLKAGSRVSTDVLDSFGGSASVKAHRQRLEAQGVLVDRVLQEDVVFNSQSGAGQFLNGTSFDGNSNWKTVSGNTPLKELL